MQVYLRSAIQRLIGLGFAPGEVGLPAADPVPLAVLVREMADESVLQVVALAGADGRDFPERSRLVAALVHTVRPGIGGLDLQVLVMHVYAGSLSAADLQSTDNLPQAVGPVPIAHWVIDLETATVSPAANSEIRDTELQLAVHPQAVWQALAGATAGSAETAGTQTGDGAESPSGTSLPQVHTPYLTYGLLVAIGLMFLVLEFTGGSETRWVLLFWGAKYGPDIIEHGQAWRLLSSVFLHGGYSHVLLNSLALWHMGRLTEALYGPWRYAAVYVLSGLSGSLLSLLLGPYDIPGVGASGAIFGLFGAMIYFRLAAPRRFPVRWSQLLWPVAINLIVGVVIPMVDNWAHVGGLLGGLAFSALVGVPGRVGALRGLAIAAVLVLAVALVAGLLPLAAL